MSRDTPKNRLSELRRSSIIGAFGPGSIVDTVPKMKGGGVVSGMLSGLSSWDDSVAAGERGVNHPQSISEPRLQKKLGVDGFRLPPAVSEEDQKYDSDVLPLIRFPGWHVCTGCEALKEHSGFTPKDGDAKHPILVHKVKGRGNCKGKEAVPVRFVVACRNGHIDDFPWKKWSGCECDDGEEDLYLRSTKAGIEGLVVECTNCDNRNGMDGAYNPKKLREAGIWCSGARPWSDKGWEMGCKERVRVLQRGASSVYFPEIHSSISIPQFTDDISTHLPTTIVSTAMKHTEEAEDRSDFEKRMRGVFKALMMGEEDLGHPIDRVIERVGRWFESMRCDPAGAPLKWAEWKKITEPLLSGNPTKEFDFEVRKEAHSEYLDPIVEGVIAASRLREVRALAGFSRVEPSKGLLRDGDNHRTVNISEEVGGRWLPAVEINGEGIMVVLREDVVKSWEQSAEVKERVEFLKRRMEGNLRPGETTEKITPRLMMLHTLSHALMRQLTLSSGYSTASLKERIYADSQEGFEMAGVLICTGSPDSEGTLGGLVRQSRSDLLEGVIEGMVEDLSWCSSDPVCIDGMVSLSTPLNGAACHACVLAPETSCEHQNLALDRALLIGTLEKPEMGFLNRLRVE